MSSEISTVVGITVSSSLPNPESLPSRQQVPSYSALSRAGRASFGGTQVPSGPSLTVMLLYSSSNMSKNISSP